MAPLGRKQRLGRLLKPESAVFLGGAALEPAISYCRDRGFSGRLYAVNSRRRRLGGLPCHRSLEALPKEAVQTAVAALSALGVAAAICNSASFSEMAGSGSARQAGLAEAAGPMPVLEPSCLGLGNFADGAVFMMEHFGRHEPGGSGVLSNGDDYLSDLGCAKRGLAVSYLVGLGNQALLSLAELLDILAKNPHFSAVNLYFEALGDVAALSRAAMKAQARDLPWSRSRAAVR